MSGILLVFAGFDAVVLSVVWEAFMVLLAAPILLAAL